MAAVAAAFTALLASIAGALVSMAGVIVALPGNVIVYLYEWFIQIGAFVWAQLQNWKFTLVLVVSVAFIVVFGPVALNQTTSVMSMTDIFTECGYRPAYEAVSKSALYNTRVNGQSLLIAYNNFALYSEDNFKRFIIDAKPTFACISSTLDISQILVLPYQFWVDFIAPSLYGAYSQPLSSKREIFPNGEWGLHDPMVNNNQEVLPNGTVPIANLTRYEFNPNFGAQGPPVVPYTRLFIYFPPRDVFVSWSNVIERAGNLLFKIIANLRRPSQLFFPSLIVDITSELSLWREGADLTCVAVEALSFMSFFPWNDSTGFQEARYYYEVYACKLLRIVACVLARISLLLNDLTTINRPATLNVNCAPAQNDPTLALEILRGIPILDIFITQIEEPLVLHNLNIFRSNIIFCQYMSDDARRASFNAAQTNVVNVALYQQMIQCGGIAAGSYPSTSDVFGSCQLWDGINPPTEQDRIDYIALLIECLTDIILLAADPLSTNTNLDAEITGAMALLTEFLNLIITRTIYAVNAYADPIHCRPDIAAIQWFSYLNNAFIDLLQYIYRPDTCTAAVAAAPTTPPSFILCFIALASRANDPIFTTLCPAFNNLSPLINGMWTLVCSKTRKRSLLASERFGPDGENEYTRRADAGEVSIFQHARMYSMYYAYHARDAWRRSAHCWRDTALNASEPGPWPPLADCECALAPCMGNLLYCFEAAVPAENPFRAAVVESGTLRNTLIGAVSLLDVTRGCDDSVLAIIYRTLATLVEVARDLALRYLVVAHKYTPTLERCMTAASADHAAGLARAEIERRFLECVGLDLSNATADNETESWSSILERSGVSAADSRSSCAAVLHKEGFVLDDVNSTLALDHEHALYRTCMFLLAYGAASEADYRRLAAAGRLGELPSAAPPPLTDYLRFDNVPLALLASTSHIDARHYDAYLPGISAALPKLPELPFDKLSQRTPRQYFGSLYQRLLNDSRDDQRQQHQPPPRRTAPHLDGLAGALYSGHSTASVAYAYIQYLADVYEKAALVASSGEEKDEIARDLFRQHLVPVGLSLDTIGERAREDFAADVAELRKRTVESAPEHHTNDAPEPQATELFRVFGNSLYWVDRLAMVVDDAVNDAKTAPANSTEIECFLSTTSRSGGIGASALVVGMRRLVDRQRSMALGTAVTPIEYRDSLALAPQRLEPFRTADLHTLSQSIEAYVRHDHMARRKGDPRLLALAQSALAAYRQLADMLALPERTTERRGRGAEMLLALGARGGATAARLASLVVRVAAILVNNRYRLHATAPVQSAMVTIDMLTNTDLSDHSLQDYQHGRVGYIPDVGFVDLETYDEWMALEEQTRAFMQRGYFSPVDVTSAFYLHPASEANRYIVHTTARRAAAARAHTKRSAGTELDGTTLAQRLLREQRALARGVSWVERSQRLQRYGYHLTDRMAHHAAGRNWRHYDAVRHSALHANDSEHRTLMLTVSSPTTSNLLTQFDWIVHTAFQTTSSTPISDFVAKAEAEFTRIGNSVTASPYSSFQKFLDYINTSGKCRGPQDYRLDGNGTYRLGCLPFISERMLNWIKDFPVNEPTHNIWNIFQGPGFIEWPPEMYAVSPNGGCPLPRDPTLSCPLNRSVATYTPNGTLVDVPANATNFGNFVLNPTLFVEDFCFTDMCTVSAAYASVRPFCPTVPTCDYCPRAYLSAAEFGFTDGWKVLAMWDAALRFLVLNFLEQPGGATGYLLLISSFFVSQFPSYAFAWVSALATWLPSSQTLSFIFLAATVGGDWFVLMNPNRFVWNFLFLNFVTLFSDVVGYVLWAVYVVVNFGPAILTFQILPFYDNVAQWIAYNLTPGPLLLLFLSPYYAFIQWFAPLIGTSVFGSPDVIRGIIVDFQTALSIGEPTFAQFFYSLMAFYQVAQLIFYGLVYIGVFVIGLGLVIILLLAVFNLLGSLFVIVIAIVTFFNSRRLSKARSDIEDLQDVATVQQSEINSLRASLASIGAPAAAVPAAIGGEAAASLISTRFPAAFARTAAYRRRPHRQD